jgi:hypothetical protein
VSTAEVRRIIPSGMNLYDVTSFPAVALEHRLRQARSVTFFALWAATLFPSLLRSMEDEG